MARYYDAGDRDTTVAMVMPGRTWEGLMGEMEAGYCPTLRGETADEVALIDLIKSAGYRVWGNQGKFW